MDTACVIMVPRLAVVLVPCMPDAAVVFCSHCLQLKTRHGCEYLMQYDTESIICDWYKAILESIRQLVQTPHLHSSNICSQTVTHLHSVFPFQEQEHLSEEEEDEASDKEDKDRKRTSKSTNPVYSL